MLHLQMRAPIKCYLGSHCLVSLSIHNEGNSIDQISNFVKIYDNDQVLKMDIFNMTLRDHQLPYHGLYLKDTETTLSFMPNEEKIWEIDLSKEYLLRAGEVSLSIITVNLFLNQNYNISNVFSSITFIEISENIPFIQTRYQESQVAFKLLNDDCEHIQRSSRVCAHKDILNVKNTLLSIENSMLRAFNYITENDPNLNQDIKEKYYNIYCNNSLSDWGYISDNYSFMKNLLLNEEIIYAFDGDKCKRGVFAYVYPADKINKIYLCDMYKRVNDFPSESNRYDSKFGVIVHELSHEAVGSKDHYYGYLKCHQDASVCNFSITSTNADCIQFFAEDSYLLMGNKTNSMPIDEL